MSITITTARRMNPAASSESSTLPRCRVSNVRQALRSTKRPSLANPLRLIRVTQRELDIATKLPYYRASQAITDVLSQYGRLLPPGRTLSPHFSQGMKMPRPAGHGHSYIPDRLPHKALRSTSVPGTAAGLLVSSRSLVSRVQNLISLLGLRFIFSFFQTCHWRTGGTFSSVTRLR
ncbi:hypothetical protein U1Q18_044851 [Sarracenia purpurea var. burkii]